MTHLRTPRFWLLTTAALIFGSSVSANAQSALTYQAGAPTMVAAAPGLPSIPAEQIARDVTSEFNPRAGARELIAAPFDPFEEDPTLAGSLRLRSADGAVDLDGRPLRDGALVEVDFYYNSPSDDPYGGRNYGDIAFVNGELAPVTLRDTRVLECSTRVENVVYDHTRYYDRRLSSGIYRPYRHYAGHSGFGFGFGNSYYGPGYGYYGSRRSFGYRANDRTRSRRPSTSRRVLDAVQNRDRDRNRNRDRDDGRRNDRRDDVTGTTDRRRTNSRRLTDRDIEERLSRVQSYGVSRPRGGSRGNARSENTPMRAGNPSERSRLTTGRASPRTQPATSESNTSQGERSQTQRPQANGTVNRRTRTRGNTNQRSETTRSSTRNTSPVRSETRRSQPTRSSTSRSNKSSSKPSRRSSNRLTRNSTRSQIKKNFFPNDGFGGRSVVSSRSVDCAREDKLRVFIPNDRLDAARFDGLTLIALDAQGGETPIYLPPNYIEGFRMAATGRVRAQGVQAAPQYTAPRPTAPQYVAPQYVTPRTTIEAAPCPSGTTLQADGTCLQNAVTGYR